MKTQNPSHPANPVIQALAQVWVSWNLAGAGPALGKDKLITIPCGARSPRAPNKSAWRPPGVIHLIQLVIIRTNRTQPQLIKVRGLSGIKYGKIPAIPAHSFETNNMFDMMWQYGRIQFMECVRMDIWRLHKNTRLTNDIYICWTYLCDLCHVHRF